MIAADPAVFSSTLALLARDEAVGNDVQQAQWIQADITQAGGLEVMEFSFLGRDYRLG